MSYEESLKEESDSVFMRVIKESLWQELADITDKTQLEWREVFQDLNHHGVYHSGEVVGLGNLVCEKCHFHLPIYTPEVLTLCLNVVMTSSRDARLSRNSLISHSNKENMGRMKFPGPCFYLYSKSSISRIS